MEARAVLKPSISIVLSFSVFVVRIIIMQPYQAYTTTWDDRMLVDVIHDNHDAMNYLINYLPTTQSSRS
jgi:hypothetical protein